MKWIPHLLELWEADILWRCDSVLGEGLGSVETL